MRRGHNHVPLHHAPRITEDNRKINYRKNTIKYLWLGPGPLLGLGRVPGRVSCWNVKMWRTRLVNFVCMFAGEIYINSFLFFILSILPPFIFLYLFVHLQLWLWLTAFISNELWVKLWIELWRTLKFILCLLGKNNDTFRIRYGINRHLRNHERKRY